MLLRLHWIIHFVALALAQRVVAAEQRVVCPTQIPESSIRLVDTPKGWTPYVASPLYLSSAGATAGPPEQQAVLMGDSTWKKGSRNWSTIYDLRGDGFPSGKWMECRYGEYDQVSLSMRLDDNTQTCTVRISGGEKAGQHAVAITCK